MAWLAPATTIKLYANVPWHSDYQDHPWRLDSGIERYAVGETYKGQYYQRDFRGYLRIRAKIADTYNINYCSFINASHENKTFFCFVDSVEYINENTVQVNYIVDVLATWQQEIEFHECLVERQHTETDNLFEYLAPEPLNCGEVVWEKLNGYKFIDNALVAICTAKITEDPKEFVLDEVFKTNHSIKENPVIYPPSSNTVNSQLNGGGAYFVAQGGASTRDYTRNVTELTNALAKQGQEDALIGLFWFPRQFSEILTKPSTGGLSAYWKEVDTANTVSRSGLWNPNISLDSLGGYVPRNKKMFTYPFTRLVVATPNSECEYALELFDVSSPSQITFSFETYLQPDTTVRAIPDNYRQNLYAYSPTVTGFPMCAWTTNSFANWFAQNRASLRTSRRNIAATRLGYEMQAHFDEFKLGADAARGGFNDTFQIGASMLTGAPGAINKTVEDAINTYYNLGSHIVDRYRQYVSLNNASNALYSTLANAATCAYESNGVVGDGSVFFGHNNLGFDAYLVYPHEHVAKIIDNFFDLYGYAINEIRVPNPTARPHYTYIKTVNANMTGKIPGDYLLAIRDIFNNGIRLWRNLTETGDYSVDNSI